MPHSRSGQAEIVRLMLSRNGKVYISHAPDDVVRCTPIVQALKDRNINCWFETKRYEAGPRLSERTMRAVAERDIFLRVCTPAAQHSVQMKLETETYRRLQSADRERGDAGKRLIVNVILDSAYVREPGDASDLTIDATNKPLSAWIVALYREAGKVKATREMSTRTLSVIVTIGVAVALLIMVYLAMHFNWMGFGTGSPVP